MPTPNQPHRDGMIRPATVTSSGDGRDHLVRDDQNGQNRDDDNDSAATRVGKRGQDVALCGHLITPAPLVAPPGPACLDCETALHRSMTTQIAASQVTCGGRLVRLLLRLMPGRSVLGRGRS